jgi:hypothetical protein
MKDEGGRVRAKNGGWAEGGELSVGAWSEGGRGKGGGRRAGTGARPYEMAVLARVLG